MRFPVFFFPALSARALKANGLVGFFFLGGIKHLSKKSENQKKADTANDNVIALRVGLDYQYEMDLLQSVPILMDLQQNIQLFLFIELPGSTLFRILHFEAIRSQFIANLVAGLLLQSPYGHRS